MTNPIAGNQFYTGMSTLAQQLPQLNVGDLKVAGDLTVAGAIRPGTFTNRVVAVTASAVVVNLTPSDSGTTYALTQTGVAQTINLPAPSVSLGVKFKFVNVANAGANIVIISQNTVPATVALQAGTQSLVGASPVDGSAPTGTSAFAGGASLVGDSLTLECVLGVDTAGPSWHYVALSNAPAGLTFT